MHWPKLFFTAVCAVSVLTADQITLSNGDKITGTVIKKEGATLTIKSEFLGEVSMPWSSVAGLTSDTQLYVVLPTGKQFEGKLITEGTTLQVQTPNQTASSPLSQVTNIRNPAEEQKYERLLHPGWLNLWAGYADLGFALARGNARTTSLTTAFVANRVTTTDKTTLFFNQIYSTARIDGIDASTADAARGGVSYDHNISPRWFFNLQNTDEYDNFQSLDFRFTAGGGLGYHAIKTEHTVLDLLSLEAITIMRNLRI